MQVGVGSISDDDLRAQVATALLHRGVALAMVDDVGLTIAPVVLAYATLDVEEVLGLAADGTNPAEMPRFAALTSAYVATLGALHAPRFPCASHILVEEEALALDLLSQLEVQGPVETQFGFHLILVTGAEMQPAGEAGEEELWRGLSGAEVVVIGETLGVRHGLEIIAG